MQKQRLTPQLVLHGSLADEQVACDEASQQSHSSYKCCALQDYSGCCDPAPLAMFEAGYRTTE